LFVQDRLRSGIGGLKPAYQGQQRVATEPKRAISRAPSCRAWLLFAVPVSAINGPTAHCHCRKSKCGEWPGPMTREHEPRYTRLPKERLLRQGGGKEEASPGVSLLITPPNPRVQLPPCPPRTTRSPHQPLDPVGERWPIFRPAGVAAGLPDLPAAPLLDLKIPCSEPWWRAPAPLARCRCWGGVFFCSCL
jgi:hypothetical protein